MAEKTKDYPGKGTGKKVILADCDVGSFPKDK